MLLQTSSKQRQMRRAIKLVHRKCSTMSVPMRFAMFELRRCLAAFAFGLVITFASGQPSLAGDNTWTNAASNFTWNTTDGNWTNPAIWNNANGDGAIFGSTGIGTITVPGAITANSIN